MVPPLARRAVESVADPAHELPLDEIQSLVVLCDDENALALPAITLGRLHIHVHWLMAGE
ncbi:hypothetical protein AQ740_18080 [Burkholderia pseudomallei]|nr:hypothetical protein AQ740_18080 [Burkholderia pseudomallei]